MNIFSEFEETYFNENKKISVNLGNAICENNIVELQKIIEKYFSKDETKIFLEGKIAYWSKENGSDQEDKLLTPALLAYKYRHRKALELIIRACGNPNLRVNNDWTALIGAATQGDRETIELLIALGADPNIGLKTDGGFYWSALGYAILEGYQKTAKLLISHGARFTINEALIAVTDDEKFSPFIEKLIRQNPDVLSQTALNDCRTLLHHAAAHGMDRIVKWLVDNGADINALDIDNRTPLWYANNEKKDSVAEYLRSKGAQSDVSASAEQNNQNGNAEPEKPEEVTHLIERFELIEDKLGIRLEGIYCLQSKRTWAEPIDFHIQANFDVVGTENKLSKSFHITLSAYNASGQLIATSSDFINNDSFLGIKSFIINLTCYEAPTRLRLYPEPL